MYYLGPIVTWFVKQRVGAVRQMMDNPRDAQRAVFNDLIQKAANTEWGKQHDFANIRTYDDFRSRMPVQDYDSLKPFIQRVMQGEQNVMWPTPIKWFSKSSGTTSDVSKFIPMSKESIEDCHYKVAQDLLALYCDAYPDTNIFSGKALVLGGSHQVNQLNQHSSYGDLSAVLLQNMSFIAQMYRVPDLDIALMDDWEQKIERLAQSTVNENITNASGVPTWMMVLAKRLFDMTGKKTLRELWPEFELYIHGGVSFTPYRDHFKQIAGPGVRYLETYNASEG
ncbi:MAG TPA: GH3 auxin-responsive promoter family protein, partial [Chitinophagales bacterium]|nr:GH3 auxin-responsive promoter family protein [Chitinophagales bacterium]